MKSMIDRGSDLAGLRTFLAIARLGSVGRAAAVLGRTQPSVSTRLANLEAQWGVPLFVRLPRGMVLTAEGERLLPLAEAALQAVDTLDAAAGLPMGGGALRIGSGDALGREVLPRALSALLAEMPEISVRFVEGPGPTLWRALRAGEIDVALGVAPEPGARLPGLTFEALLESHTEVFYAAGSGPRRNGVSIHDLAGERIVTLQEGSGFRRHLERAFAEAGVPFEPAVEVGNLSLVRRFVAAGAGAAAVPAVAFTERSRGPKVDRRLLLDLPPITYVSASRAEAPVPDPVRRFLQKL